ncbi:hypothetical protein P9112_005499 [Eukaryota sp. TZLM1-RC]
MRPLSSPFYLSVKTGLASALALLIDMLIRNEDHVTSTFVSVLSTSPSVSLGLVRGAETMFAASIGGVFGFIGLVFAFPPMLNIPLSVPLSVLVMVITGYEQLFAISAFSALFVSLIVYGSPLNTLFMRFKSISSGILAAAIVNVAVSAWQYQHIYTRKMQIVKQNVMDNLEMVYKVSRENPLAAGYLFTLIDEFHRTLSRAKVEAKVFCTERIRTLLNNIALELGQLQNLLHVLVDISYYLYFDTDISKDEATSLLQDIIAWLRGKALQPEATFAVDLQPQMDRLKRSLGYLEPGSLKGEKYAELESKV